MDVVLRQVVVVVVVRRVYLGHGFKVVTDDIVDQQFRKGDF